GEVSVFINAVQVAGDVPATLYIVGLTHVVEVAATRRADDGKATQLAGGHFVAIIVEHGGPVSGNRLARGARADVAAGGRDEDVQQLAGPDAIDESESARTVHGVERLLGQVLTR